MNLKKLYWGIKMKKENLKSDLDFIKLYAIKIREDNKYFKQQKSLIDSQLKASQSLFRNRFGTGEKFRINARKYLKETKNL